MSLSPAAEFSTRRLAHAARAKGIPLEAYSQWLTRKEQEIAAEVYAETLYLSANLYLRRFGEK